MAAQPDLWGEIVPAQVRTPVAVMREQATLLGRKTNNLVEARVRTRVYEGRFIHYFELVVPALDNYTYELFAVTHGVQPYPVRRGSLLLPPYPEFPSEEAFVEWLRQELSSPETMRIVANLLAQVSS